MGVGWLFLLLGFGVVGVGVTRDGRHGTMVHGPVVGGATERGVLMLLLLNDGRWLIPLSHYLSIRRGCRMARLEALIDMGSEGLSPLIEVLLLLLLFLLQKVQSRLHPQILLFFMLILLQGKVIRHGAEALVIPIHDFPCFGQCRQIHPHSYQWFPSIIPK